MGMETKYIVHENGIGMLHPKHAPLPTLVSVTAEQIIALFPRSKILTKNICQLIDENHSNNNLHQLNYVNLEPLEWAQWDVQ